MELSQISNVNNSVINYTNLEKTTAIKNIDSLSNDLKSNDINVDSIKDNQSDFSNKLTNSISQMANLQNLELNINNQINIVNKISLNIENSPTPEALDNIQPEVKSLMDNFNSNMRSIPADLNKMIEDQSSEESTTFFDGILGSKPLSPADIMNATERKLEQLQTMKANTKETYEDVVKEIKSDFTQEKQSSQEKSPFKEINFGKESSDFTSSTINNTIGSIATTQANPSQAHSIRLLSQ